MFSQDIDAASAVAIGFQLYSQKHAERGLNCHTTHRVLHGTSLNFVMFRMSMFEVSPMCFGVSFVRQRFGGAAPVAEIAWRMVAGAPRQRRDTLALNHVVRRVFGEHLVNDISRSMRTEFLRMLQPVQPAPSTTFLRRMQVMVLGGAVFFLTALSIF
jgi:hypothetical protein